MPDDPRVASTFVLINNCSLSTSTKYNPRNTILLRIPQILLPLSKMCYGTPFLLMDNFYDFPSRGSVRFSQTDCNLQNIEWAIKE